ncbi:MAG: hypothetical protein SGI83_19055 [Bacteroidota bacterium]|nr:hypothetical protein [Bacteroidota bacterium]
MKQFILVSALTTLLLSNSDCNKKTSTGTRYKGKLEIAGICMNYTIRVTEGNPDTSIVAANWTDESTKKSYTNVFRLGNPCDFPATIKQGDEFYFTIDTTKGKDCIVCMAYYPTPSKAVSIKIAE